MTAPSTPSDAYGPPERLRFPQDEQRHPWLGILLDVYRLTDQGVHEGVRREQAQGRRLACARGCAACCRSHLTIPVYPLELMGIYWFASERLEGPLRERLAAHLASFQKGRPCPFLVDEACSIHPVRPMACRHFNVFGRVCAEGEDAYHTRRSDVLTPLRGFQEQALERMLAYHGLKSKGERRRSVKSGEVHRLVRVLQEVDWPKLAGRMGAGGQGVPPSD